jgi:hypothetical protein
VSATLVTGKQVAVHVDEARNDVETSDIDHLLGGSRGGDIRVDLGDLAAGNRNVRHTVAAILRIDHCATLQQQFILLGAGGTGPKQKADEQDRTFHRRLPFYSCPV